MADEVEFHYFAALVAAGLVPRAVVDWTDATVPYWELRARCAAVATGVEVDFLDAYREDSFRYLLIVADRP